MTWTQIGVCIVSNPVLKGTARKTLQNICQPAADSVGNLAPIKGFLVFRYTSARLKVNYLPTVSQTYFFVF